jgi:hypothetical protein
MKQFLAIDQKDQAGVAKVVSDNDDRDLQCQPDSVCQLELLTGIPH